MQQTKDRALKVIETDVINSMESMNTLGRGGLNDQIPLDAVNRELYREKLKGWHRTLLPNNHAVVASGGGGRTVIVRLADVPVR
jgi:hypothetical protein